jgi:hypothetical protein
MKRFIPLALVAGSIAFPATADAKFCPGSGLSGYKVTGVTCAKAKAVIKEFKQNGSPAKGFTCKEKSTEDGTTITCTKGDKRIKYFSNE